MVLGHFWTFLERFEMVLGDVFGLFFGHFWDVLGRFWVLEMFLAFLGRF